MIQPFKPVDYSKRMRCELDAEFAFLSVGGLRYRDAPRLVGLIDQASTLEGYDLSRHIRDLVAKLPPSAKGRFDRHVEIHRMTEAQAVVTMARTFYMNVCRSVEDRKANIQARWDARKERMALRDACQEPASKPKRAGRL